MGFDIEVGTACNNKCIFCSAGSRKSSDFSTEQILKLLQEHAGSDSDCLCITGGEPTVRPDFPQIISSAVNAGYDYILLQSNGRAFADAEFAKKAVGLGLKEFLISLHGADAAVHDALTQVPGSFEQTIHGIENIIRLGGNVTTLTVITIGNFRQLLKITKMVLDLGIDAPVYAFPMLEGRAPGNFDVLVPRYVDIAPSLVESFEIIRKRSPHRAHDSSVQDVPFCFLQGMERHVHEVNYAEMRSIYYSKEHDKIKDAQNMEDTYNRDNEVNHRIQKKIKPSSCEKCIYFQPCEGIQKEYINQRGSSEFVPVISPDPSVEIKNLSVTLPGSMVPALDPDCRFNGRDFGGFLILEKNLIVVTNRGRFVLSLLSGKYTLSEISALAGADALSFVYSLKERELLSFFEAKTSLSEMLLSLQEQIKSSNLSDQGSGALEIPLYTPWRESYIVTLV